MTNLGFLSLCFSAIGISSCLAVCSGDSSFHLVPILQPNLPSNWNHPSLLWTHGFTQVVTSLFDYILRYHLKDLAFLVFILTSGSRINSEQKPSCTLVHPGRPKVSQAVTVFLLIQSSSYRRQLSYIPFATTFFEPDVATDPIFSDLLIPRSSRSTPGYRGQLLKST